MKKAVQLLLLVTAVIYSAHAQQRLFDQRMKLKSCNITIDANPFMATTFIEMEFYNPKDEEVEGLHSFELKRGQVVTAFQLELNGKYRDGSIEERWKANRAYSTIVGKRIDPAILQMDWQNHYSLRIYPIPAKSSRKITLTITQMMEEDSNRLTYFLPLHLQDSTETVTVKAVCSTFENAGAVISNKGLLEQQDFTNAGTVSTLNWSSNNCILNKPVSFSLVRNSKKPLYCAVKKDNGYQLVMRVFPDVPKTYQVQPESLQVYWDVSFSAKERDLVKEINFLEAYLKSKAVKKVYITLFNQQEKQQRVFSFPENSFYSIRQYLLNCNYEGATLLGSLDFSKSGADMILLFSDGINSYGRQLPQQGHVPVNCITSSTSVDYTNLLKISAQGAGSVINLLNTPTEEGIKKISVAENYLSAIKGKGLLFNEQFPLKIEKNILVTGTAAGTGDFTLVYGNSSNISKTENYFLSADGNCGESLYAKLKMLKTYDSLIYAPSRYWSWQDLIVFGLTEKVVTPQTSYLVLERIEDYIKYNIAPPAELVEQCAERNYVYNSGYKINVLKRSTQQDALRDVSKAYNERIQWWDKTAALIQPDELTVGVIPAAGGTAGNMAQTSQAQGFTNNSGGGELQEVVVTGSFGVRRAARMVTGSVQSVSAEQLTTVRQVNLNNALAGKVAGLQVRSQSYAKLGAASEAMIRLRGENGLTEGRGVLYVVNGTIMDNSSDINVDDIEDVTVLQAPAAAALFGPDGANGAIVINTKKARRGYSYPQRTWSNYKLSDMEDVDYLQEIKKNDKADAWSVYERLQKEHSAEPAFYFDMADYFFESSQPDHAQKILFTAIELCKGNTAGIRLAAFVLEKWKYFDTAIELYKQILATEENNMPVKRDLALAYMQNKNYQQAVNTYYNLITTADNEKQNLFLKENALAELNAVIALDIKDLDISFIDKGLVKILPAALRIALEGNNNSVNNMQVLEPGSVVCNYTNPLSSNGGRLKTDALYWYTNTISEYIIKQAPAGKYKIRVNANGYYGYYGNRMPEVIRIVSFKNFHTKNMTIDVQHVSIDNQYGVVEIGEVVF